MSLLYCCHFSVRLPSDFDDITSIYSMDLERVHELGYYTLILLLQHNSGKTSDTADWARMEPPCSEVVYWATVFAHNVLYNISNPPCAYVLV